MREWTLQGYGIVIEGKILLLENEGRDYTRVWQGARKAGTGLYKGMEEGMAWHGMRYGSCNVCIKYQYPSLCKQQ